jgi:NAD(P)H-nitrite reductase large subunit
MKKQSKGLGDTIAKITEATGIDKLVKFVAGEDCGCEERKEKLNKLFPYVKPNCLTEEEFKTLDEFFSLNTQQVTNVQQRDLVKVSNRVFNRQDQQTSCSSCLRDLVGKLKVIHAEYTPEQTEETTTENAEG